MEAEKELEREKNEVKLMQEQEVRKLEDEKVALDMQVEKEASENSGEKLEQASLSPGSGTSQ